MNATEKKARFQQIVFLGLFQLLLIVAVVSMWQADAFKEGGWFLLLIEMLLLGFAAYVLYLVPVVSLDENGVNVRIFIKKQRYSWKEIKQAGILQQFRRYGYNSVLVLLKPNGTPRGYKDKAFVIRNAGKLIYLSASDGVVDYVIAHYGPLDFDLWDNPDEKSVLVD